VFAVSEEDGMVRVTGRLDRETRGHYVLSVIAQDHGIPPRYVSGFFGLFLLIWTGTYDYRRVAALLKLDWAGFH
jgi:hypothetical protein